MRPRLMTVTVSVCLFAMFFYLECCTFDNTLSLLFRINGALTDTAIMIMPFVFLKRKWSLLLYIFMPLLGLLLLSNIVYFRNFADLIPPSSYLGNLVSDPIIVEGALNSLRLSDALFLISFVPLILYFVCDGSGKYMELKPRGAILSVMAILISITVFGAARRVYINNDDKSVKAVIGNIFSRNSIYWKYYANGNFGGYMAVVALHAVKMEGRLTPEEADEIRSYLTDHSKTYPLHTFEGPVPRNLIIIVVESLQSNVLSDKRNLCAMPTLDSLRNDTSTCFIEKCRNMAGPGRSSDAQFVINTGLLPLKEEPLVNNYIHKDYPSLAKALGGLSTEVIGESRAIWKHGASNRSYGFSGLVDNVAFGADQDSIIFDRAFREYAAQPALRFLLISTLSMHDPYIDSRVTGESDITDSCAEKQEYLRRLRHFDRSLKRFLDAVKKEDKARYDDTLIVIVGDHEIRPGEHPMFPKDEYVPLFIINSPVKSLRTTEVCQADIFPTIMELMQLRYRFMDADYIGLGVSLTYKRGMPEPREAEASDISRLIITRKY